MATVYHNFSPCIKLCTGGGKLFCEAIALPDSDLNPAVAAVGLGMTREMPDSLQLWRQWQYIVTVAYYSQHNPDKWPGLCPTLWRVTFSRYLVSIFYLNMMINLFVPQFTDTTCIAETS
jgi:hypothetical protein